MSETKQMTGSGQILFLDLGTTYRELKNDVDAAVARVLASGWYIGGPEVEAFEDEFATYCGAKYCIGVANGLDALTLALSGAGITAGDEVIVPSNTYIATWLAVTHVGARPVPVEPDDTTFNLSSAGLEAALSSRTRAVLPVHLYGRPADMAPINEFAARHSLFVLDDAAQAHGASYNGRRVGAIGNATAWSFYPGKNLGAFGDAGAVTTNDDALADRIRVLRNYGSRVKYKNEVVGWNSRLDPLQAAVLRTKLPYLETWNARRDNIASMYDKGLTNSSVRTPPSAAPGNRSAQHLYVIRTAARDRLQSHLSQNHIQTLIHYPIPPHLQDAYRTLAIGEGALPIAERMHREVLSLPIGPHLEEAEAQRVVDAVLSFAP